MTLHRQLTPMIGVAKSLAGASHEETPRKSLLVSSGRFELWGQKEDYEQVQNLQMGTIE